MSARNVIQLKKFHHDRIEKLASGEVTPGHILELTSGDLFKVHASASGDVNPVIVADFRELEGKEITDVYPTGTRVFADVYTAGEEFQGILADGESAVIGSKLKSNGNGELAVYTAASGDPDFPNAVIGTAMEVMDRSTSSGGDTNTTGRLAVMVGR